MISIAIGYNTVNNLGGNTTLISGKLYLDVAGTDPVYYRESFGAGDWSVLETGGTVNPSGVIGVRVKLRLILE